MNFEKRAELSKIYFTGGMNKLVPVVTTEELDKIIASALKKNPAAEEPNWKLEFTTKILSELLKTPSL